MNVRFVTNIPAPYRLEFFNELGKYVDLTIVFEAQRNYALHEMWYSDCIKNFICIFLKTESIKERKVNWKILKEVKPEKQDVLIFTNYSYFTEMVGLIKAKLMKIPYWLELDGAQIRSEGKFKFLIKSFLICGAQKYLSSGKTTDAYLKQYGVSETKIFRYPFTSLKQIDLLPRMLNTQEKEKEKACLNIAEKNMVLCVGQFIPRKGFDVLLNAARELSPDIGVYFVGGEPTKEYLQMQTKFDLQNVHFVGFKSQKDLQCYYRAADVFVLPTRQDIWGLVINEAMANALPVITTNQCVAGLELIQDDVNGYIVEVDDAPAISNHIQTIIFDEEKRENMACNSLAKIQKYTIENMAKVHVAIVKQQKYDDVTL